MKKKEFLGPWETDDKYRLRGVPKEFERTSLNLIENGEEQFLLVSFQKVMKQILNPQNRKSVLSGLKEISLSEKKVDEIAVIKERLEFDVYRYVTGMPFSMLYGKEQPDDVKRNFFTLICRGIDAYQKASPETRKKFDDAVDIDIKKEKMRRISEIDR